jgi:hypothetical protein
MRNLISALILLFLTGCVTAQNTAGLPDSEARRDYLRYAGAAGPVYLRVMTWPLRLGDRETVGGRMAADATGAVYAMPTAFTADPSVAPQPHFRIVATFDYPQSFSPSALCAADQADQGPGVVPDSDETSLLLAFCTRGELLAGTRVRGPRVANLNDPAFRDMVRYGIREMFSFDDPRHDRRRFSHGVGFGFGLGTGFGTGW